MIKRFYYWFLQKTARPEDRGGISAGYWQGKIRDAAIRSCGTAPCRILEVGCGEGLFLRDLLKAGPDLSTFGIDLYIEQLTEAARRITRDTGAKAGLSQADATELPFKNGSFDIVVAINLILNMPSEAMIGWLLKEIGRVCKDGGKIVFDIRNSRSPIIYIKYKLAPFYDGSVKAKQLPLTVCDPASIEKKLADMGFDTVKKASIGFPKGRFAPVIVFEAEKRKRPC
jgi:ubiquinone/menaquinone biosynthesis C-methylase UbiE